MTSQSESLTNSSAPVWPWSASHTPLGILWEQEICITHVLSSLKTRLSWTLFKTDGRRVVFHSHYSHASGFLGGKWPRIWSTPCEFRAIYLKLSYFWKLSAAQVLSLEFTSWQGRWLIWWIMHFSGWVNFHFNLVRVVKWKRGRETSSRRRLTWKQFNTQPSVACSCSRDNQSFHTYTGFKCKKLKKESMYLLWIDGWLTYSSCSYYVPLFNNCYISPFWSHAFKKTWLSQFQPGALHRGEKKVKRHSSIRRALCNKFKLKCVGVAKLRLTHKGMLLLHLSAAEVTRSNFVDCSADARMKSLSHVSPLRDKDKFCGFLLVTSFIFCPALSRPRPSLFGKRSAAPLIIFLSPRQMLYWLDFLFPRMNLSLLVELEATKRNSSRHID